MHDFVVAWQNIEGAGPMFIYTTRDSNTGGFNDEENFGLFKTDWTPKEAALTVTELLQELKSGNLQPFDVTPYANKTTFLEAAVIVVRQAISLALIVPRTLYQLAVSAVTVITHAIGSLLGITPPASATQSVAKTAAAQPNRKKVAHAAPGPKLSVPRVRAPDKLAANKPKARHTGGPAPRRSTH